MEILTEHRQWIRATARSYAKGDPELTKDYEQEALVAMWETLQKEPNAPVVHLRMRARNRLNNCYTRGVWTGQARRGHSSVIAMVPLDSESPVWDRLPPVVEAAELAYHADEIESALMALTPSQREYVYLRFWRDYDTHQLTEHFGYKPFALWSHPQRGAKHRLAESLSHLRSIEW